MNTVRFAIHKYPVPSLTGVHVVAMPWDSEVISAGIQDDQIVVWARHHVDEGDDPIMRLGAEMVPATDQSRSIGVYWTGMPFEVPAHGEARFLATLTTSGGVVWHLYDRGAK